MNETSIIQFGLSKKQLQLILNVIDNFDEIEKVIIFGSRAKGTNKPGSDIDLAVIGYNLTSLLINRLHSTIDELPLPFMFDIVNYNKIKNEALKKKIDAEGKLLFERKLNIV